MLKNKCIHIQSFFFVLGGQNVQYCAFHPSCPWRFILSCHLVCASQNLALLKISLYFFQSFWLTHSLSIPKWKAGERQMWSDTGERFALLRLSPCHLKSWRYRESLSSSEMNKPGCSVTLIHSQWSPACNSKRERLATDSQDQESRIIGLFLDPKDVLSHFLSHWNINMSIPCPCKSCRHEANTVFRAVLGWFTWCSGL